MPEIYNQTLYKKEGVNVQITPHFDGVYTSGPITFTYSNGTVVKLNELKENVDYTLRYGNNNEYNTIGTVSVDFIGNYSGVVTRRYNILKPVASLDGVTYYVVPRNHETINDPIRYGEVNTLGDLMFVNENDEEITSIKWLDENTEINAVGNLSFYVTYNPDPENFDDGRVLINVLVNKGQYDRDSILNMVNGKTFDSDYHARITLNDIALPEGFSWEYQVVDVPIIGQEYLVLQEGKYIRVLLTQENYSPSTTYYEEVTDLDKSSAEYIIGDKEYIEFTFEAKYNINPMYFEDETDILVTIRIYKGDLDSTTFNHRNITVTYAPNLTASSIALSTNSPWSWKLGQEGINTPLNAREAPYVFTMIYNPMLTSGDGAPIDGGFPSNIYGKKENYNTVEVSVNVYVNKATYTPSQVQALLSYYRPQSFVYSTDLMIGEVNLNLPEGFSVRDPNTRLYYGVNNIALVYNRNSETNSNYNSYGERLSETISVNVTVNSPTLQGTLDVNGENVVSTPDMGLVINREWDDMVGGQNPSALVPYIVTYYNPYNNTWSEVRGEARWVNGSEHLLEVGYITKQLMFYPEDKNFTANSDYRLFDVTLKVDQVAMSYNSLLFVNPEQTITFSKEPTLGRFGKLTTTDNKFLDALADVYYTYEIIYFNAEGEATPSGEEIIFTQDTVLNAGGRNGVYSFAYRITPKFDRGSCVYYTFTDGVVPTLMLYIDSVDLNITIEDVRKTYGDRSISGDISNFVIEGLRDLSTDDYEFGIYNLDNERIRLGYNTPVGTYKIILRLRDRDNEHPELKTNYNYNYPNSQVVADYVIGQKEISQFEVRIEGGMLRENGTILNDKISIEFNAAQFVDGVVPEYEIRFTRDGTLVNNVISAGTYYVSIVFVDGNYAVTTTRSFVVYAPQSYTVLFIVLGFIVGTMIVILIAVLAVKANRKRIRRNMQKEQLKRLEGELKKQESRKDSLNQYTDKNKKK